MGYLPSSALAWRAKPTTFNDPRDGAGRARLENTYPDPEIKMLDAKAISAMGGGMH